ncbi:MAG: hypothetical protein SFV15_25590 [Polyangiaceae bacterium]|nr:hypothetical protein [Polyangiaceae bacterium]
MREPLDLAASLHPTPGAGEREQTITFTFTAAPNGACCRVAPNCTAAFGVWGESAAVFLEGALQARTRALLHLRPQPGSESED